MAPSFLIYTIIRTLPNDILAYQEDDNDDGIQLTALEMLVDEVEFGLTRIRIANNTTDFYLVPAYTFRGTRTMIYSHDFRESYNNETILVINAIDGTIINTELGY